MPTNELNTQMTPTPCAWLCISASDIEELGSLLCGVADNLGDMPVSDEWAAKTSSRARALLARNKYFRRPDAAQERVATPCAWLTETGRQALQDGDGPVRAMPAEDADIGFTVPLFDQAAIDAAVAAERERLTKTERP